MLRTSTLLCLIAAALQTACATFQGASDEGRLRDSVLSNKNPAPASLAPPDYVDKTSLGTLHAKSQADYHFTLGESLSFEGKPEKAIEEFKLTLVYDPSSTTVRLRLAEEFVRAGMISEAVEQAEGVVGTNPESNEARLFLGGIYTSMKMYDAAGEQFRAILSRTPGHPEAAVYLGAILAEQKDFDAALEHFNSLITNPKFTDKDKAYLYIGKIQIEHGRESWPAAEQSFIKGQKFKPESDELVVALGQLYKAQGHLEKMERLWKTHQDKFGPDRETARGLSRYYLEKERYDDAVEQLDALAGFEKDNLNVRIQIALIYIEQKKHDKAVDELDSILEQAPELDKVRYYLAAVHEELGQFGEAIAHYRQVPPASPYFVDSVIHAAHLIKESGKLEEAVELVKAGTASRDDVPNLFAYYATLLDAQKAYPDAIKMLTTAVEKFPTYAQLRFFLGSMYDRVGKTDETIVHMQKVLDIEPNNVQALNFLAYTFAEQNRDLEQAEDLARRAYDLEPKDGYILDTVGWVLFKKGKTDESIRFLEAAYASKSNEAVIAEHLGDAYLRHEMWQRAARMYRRAAELETDRDKVERIRNKLASTETQVQRPLRVPASTPAQ